MVGVLVLLGSLFNRSPHSLTLNQPSISIFHIDFFPLLPEVFPFIGSIGIFWLSPCPFGSWGHHFRFQLKKMAYASTQYTLGGPVLCLTFHGVQRALYRGSTFRSKSLLMGSPFMAAGHFWPCLAHWCFKTPLTKATHHWFFLKVRQWKESW